MRVKATSHIPIKACYYPAIENEQTLLQCQKQAQWHFSPIKDRIVTDFPRTVAEAAASARVSDVIFFWEKSAFWGAKASYRRKGIIVDEYAQQAVGDTLDTLVARYIKPDNTHHSKRFFSAVHKRHSHIEQALIIGSGPDMAVLESFDTSTRNTTLSLYLSTSVLNERACEICPPDIIIAVDGPSQFGPSATARLYRERTVDLIRRHDSIMLVPAQHLPSIRAHWPDDIQNNVFAVPLTRLIKYGHSFREQWHYEPTSNVLTSFGLPCAASFTKSIIFAGISLTQDDDSAEIKSHHWDHMEEALYQKHVAPMLICHPASGQVDGGYLGRHYARLKHELAAHAASGIEFSKLGASPLKIQPIRYDRNTTKKLPLKVRFFEYIAQIEHRPSLIISFSFILAGLLGTALQYSIGWHMLGFIIAGSLAAFLIAGLLFLRLRQNRLTARLESKLSQQQTQQFANLSERLEALETKK